MFSVNPFSGLATAVPPWAMQGFLLLMIAFVVAGTLFDMWHKRSARYFFTSWRAAGARRTREITARGMASIAVRSALVDSFGSGEFCSQQRRLAHLLTMYGFIAYVVATIILVFFYTAPDTPAPAIVPWVWHVGALMVCVGGYWFWFFIRVDVASEGRSPFRVMRADLFVLSLVASVTLALVWSGLQSAGSASTNTFLALYLIATVILFGSVPWSKFSHMFYKPAAAFHKRIEDAGGSRSNLPPVADRPAVFGSAGQRPRHY